MLRRLWQSLRSSTRFAGEDLEGNRFFERQDPSNGLTRTKRTVEYKNPDDMWKYIGGGKRLPVQWTTWLTHTRQDPPTLQELQVDLSRQQQVVRNAALIEARELEQRRQSLLVTDGSSNSPQSALRNEHPDPLPTSNDRTTGLEDDVKHRNQPEGTSNEHKSPFKNSDTPYEAQPWTPQIRRRG